MGSTTLPPFALYKPDISEDGYGALVDTNFDLLAANSNAQLALGMFDYIITYGDVGDGNGVQARAINLRTYSVVASGTDYATVHNALVDSFPSNGANVLVRSAVEIIPLTTSLRFNKYVGGTWTIMPGQWVFGGRSFRFRAVSSGWTNGPNGSIMMDLEAGGVNGTRGGKKLLYGPFCDANSVVDRCIVALGKGTPANSEGDDNWIIGPICIKFKVAGISYGTPADAIATPPNGSCNTWTFGATVGDAACTVAGFEFNVGDGQVLWCQVAKPGAAAYYSNGITTTVIGGHATLDSSVAGYIAQIAQGTNFQMDDVYFDNIAGSNLGAVGVVAVDPGGAQGIHLAAVRVRISNCHFNMNAATPIMVIDNAAGVSNIGTFVLRNANAPGQTTAHTSSIVHFKDLRGSGSSLSVGVSNAIAASTVIDGGDFNNTDAIFTKSGTTDAAARPTLGRFNISGADVSGVPIKAGVPVDADYVQAMDGMQVLDVSGSKMYVRVGGVWTALN